MTDDCIFCKIAGGLIPVKKLHDSARFCAFADINPQAPTHVLLIPREHIASLNELSGRPELLGELNATAIRLAAELGLSQNGYRLLMNCGDHGGQTVYHVHLHILGGRPMRWPPG